MLRTRILSSLFGLFFHLSTRIPLEDRYPWDESSLNHFNHESKANRITNLHLLTSGLLHLAILLQADGRHTDETGGLGGGEVTDLVHAGLGHVVQLLGLGVAAQDGEAALVGAAADHTVDGLLRGLDRVLEELTLGREVQAVVEDLLWLIVVPENEGGEHRRQTLE